LLTLPAAGLAAVLLQVTDEGPHPLNANDAAAIGLQTGPRAAAAGVFDPYDAPGTLLARGTNTRPTGSYRLQTYVLEEVVIPSGVPIPALGGRTDLTTVWRLSVLGGPFAVRAMPAVIWADDVPLGNAALSPDLTRATVLVTDPSLLRTGATIAFSYGDLADLRARLPEPLALPVGSR
jgi:hypothetical protein